MNRIATDLEGVWIFEPKVFGDGRGFFMETWNRDRYAEAGLTATFVQDNVSRSSRGVLRGLHYQTPNGQGKLVQVLEGEVLDAAVDIRVGSPTFGRSVAVTLSDTNFRQLYIPPGFAHGFYVQSPTAIFAYKCTAFYNPAAEGGVLWNDPDLKIPWMAEHPLLSEKDGRYPRLKDISPDKLPHYGDAR